jgi:hypothetical protein
VKFSVRQILASAAGAVLAALIASSFGVKGTIVGVAIGSIAATLGTALVAQSIERGHEAVKQVVVRAPDSTLLRRLGGTSASGDPQATAGAEFAPTEAIPTTSGSGAADDRAAAMESTVPAAADTARLEVSAVAGAPPTERLDAVTLPSEPATQGRRSGDMGRRFSWKAIAGTAGVVFLVALLFVTAVELVSGKPLSSIFGDHGTGPSVKDIFVPSSPPPAPATTTTTTTTSVPASTTTTTGGAGASSTTTVSTTTTTSPSSRGSTTTTTGASGTSTTTTAPGGTTTSSAPG